MSRARLVRARFARKLELDLQVPNRLVYHLPHGRAKIWALATWRGKPLAGVHVKLVITCPGRRATAVLTTRRDGRASFLFGVTMPNSLRIYTCKVRGRVRANHRTARQQRAGIVRFVHPLWLQAKVKNGKIVVRIWGRPGEQVQLFADGELVSRARIGRGGWVDLVSREIRHGDRLRVTGPNGHTSHRITA
jgi:hypothetical protein